jgi:hypothetical protein
MEATIRYKDSTGLKIIIVAQASTKQLLYLKLQSILYQHTSLRGTKTSILINFDPGLDTVAQLGNMTDLILWIDHAMTVERLKCQQV